MSATKGSNKRRSVIWIVEDEPDIACIFTELLVAFDEYMVVCVDDARDVRAEATDIIFLDMRGTRSKDLVPNGAKVITMSGDGGLNPQISKPFRFDDIRELIKRYSDAA